MIEIIIEEKQKELSAAVNKYLAGRGIENRIDAEDIEFDDSRAWSISVPGHLMDLGCNKFGAYRPYLGGGVRGSIENNGRDEEGTKELGEMFENALLEIEKAYNEELTPEASESWELATGVLL